MCRHAISVMHFAKQKSRLKAALQLNPIDRGSGDQQCWLRFAAIGHEAETSEAKQ
jgi:hypothetical protein